MAKYEVKSVGMNLTSRTFINERVEIVDTDKSPLYASANAIATLAPFIIERIYETFWNIPTAEEAVKVIGVSRIS